MADYGSLHIVMEALANGGCMEDERGAAIDVLTALSKDRHRLTVAVERAVPSRMVVWPAPYDRRFGDLDQRDRFELVEGIVDAVVAVLTPPLSGANGGEQ